MTTLAVTGHINLTPDSVPLVRGALERLVAEHAGPDLVGVSCIAAGADSLFAEAVLAAGGHLIVVVPSKNYRAAKVGPAHVEQFDRLVDQAADVLVMPHETPGWEAYAAANGELLRRADRLVAVWNGAPPGGKGGGTADVVVQARAARIPIDVVWPEGAARLDG